MSRYHAKGIRGFAELQKHEIVHLREKFDPATPDPVWIEALGNERDWLIVSGDAKITRNPVNRAAWLESRLTAFFFSEPWTTDSFWKQCPSLVPRWPEIVRCCYRSRSIRRMATCRTMKRRRTMTVITSSRAVF